MQTIFPAVHLVIQFYVAHPPLWWYCSLLQRKLWPHKRKRFTNLKHRCRQRFSSISSCFPIYVAHPPLSSYCSLLQRKLWRHKRKRFTNLMIHMKEVFIVAHLFHCYVIEVYVFHMSSLFFCVLLDITGFKI